jgi:hypothetical protein
VSFGSVGMRDCATPKIPHKGDRMCSAAPWRCSTPRWPFGSAPGKAAVIGETPEWGLLGDPRAAGAYDAAADHQALATGAADYFPPSELGTPKRLISAMIPVDRVH